MNTKRNVESTRIPSLADMFLLQRSLGCHISIPSNLSCAETHTNVLVKRSPTCLCARAVKGASPRALSDGALGSVAARHRHADQHRVGRRRLRLKKHSTFTEGAIVRSLGTRGQFVCCGGDFWRPFHTGCRGAVCWGRKTRHHFWFVCCSTGSTPGAGGASSVKNAVELCLLVLAGWRLNLDSVGFLQAGFGVPGVNSFRQWVP